MATRTTKRKTSSSRSRYNEITAIVFFAAGVLILLCLVSADPMDPSLSTASSKEPQNWIGVVGSVVADVLFQTFGVLAYTFP